MLYNDKTTLDTVWEHLDKALALQIPGRGLMAWPWQEGQTERHVESDTGKGIAESVFHLYALLPRGLEMLELAKYLKKDEAAVSTEGCEEMKKPSRDTWDGDW